MIQPRIDRLTVQANGTVYDCLIAAAGYETRAPYIARKLKGSYRAGYAPGFDDNLVLSFDRNKEWFTSHDFEYERLKDEEFEEWACNVLYSLQPDKDGSLSIAIDISCFNRFRIATLIDILRRFDRECRIQVDFFYNIAKYSPPPSEQMPNVHIGPVLEAFAGWSTEPEQSITAVVGVGYEEDRALGAVEHIQASKAWLYVPRSPIHEYEDAVAEANETLFDLIPADKRITYWVHDPFHTFTILEGLVYKSLLDDGVVMFPFGPKIYAVCCLLVATLHEDAAVWRVSPGDLLEPRDREPSEHVVSLRADFNPEYHLDRVTPSLNEGWLW